MLVFVASSGRVGTHYISHLFSNAGNSVSYHEPHPEMTGEYVDLVNSYGYEYSYDRRRDAKVTAIRKY